MQKAIIDRIRPVVQLEDQAVPFLKPRASVGAMAIFVLPLYTNGYFEGFGTEAMWNNLEVDTAPAGHHRLRLNYGRHL